MAVNAGGPLIVDFPVAVQSVTGFLTYGVPVKITAFQPGGLPLSSLTTLFASNLATSQAPGSASNESFAFTSALGIVSITLGNSSIAAGAYALDDLSVTAAAVPEPASTLLFGLGLGSLMLLRSRLRIRRAASVACVAATLPLGVAAFGELGTLTLLPPSVPSKAATGVVVTAKVVDPKQCLRFRNRRRFRQARPRRGRVHSFQCDD